MQALDAKVAVVTGANRGIGRAIALRLAADGAQVVLSARGSEKLTKVVSEIRSAGGQAAAIPLDLRDSGSAQKLVDFAQAQFGGIDILVNNAGATKRGEFTELSDTEWEDGFALKFFGAVRLSRAAWPSLKDRSGSLVNVAGVGGRTPGPEFAIGGSVNAALLSLTKALADVGLRDDIQVNAVNPGPVRTDRLAARLASPGTDPDVAERRFVQEAKITRVGESDDIAGLIAFIVSPAGRFFQGALIDMDGGQTKTFDATLRAVAQELPGGVAKQSVWTDTEPFLPAALASAILLLTTLLTMPVKAAPAHTLTGDFCLHPRFHSRFLKADHDVLVFLPPGYDAGRKQRYPVLYLQDGQNLFDGATSFLPGQEWRVDETATDLIQRGVIEPLIIVGVYNVGADRIDEYTPTKAVTGTAAGYGGGADLYGRMLVEELKPYIDRHYRTRTDPAHTGLGGSSLGGLLALYVGLKYPGTFGQIACVSPSAWWDGRMIVRQVRALPKKPSLRVWLDIGTAEDLDSADAVRDLHDALLAKGWKAESDLHYLEAAGAQHNEAAWADRVAPLLTFLFPKH